VPVLLVILVAILVRSGQQAAENAEGAFQQSLLSARLLAGSDEKLCFSSAC
jgi:hypothetical protein